MINLCFGHRRLPVVVSLVVALCLLVAGMRVPDISRPHRAKPKHRAVIENKNKSFQPSIKKSVEFVAVLQDVAPLPAPPQKSADFQVSCPIRFISPIFPNSARSPPLFS